MRAGAVVRLREEVFAPDHGHDPRIVLHRSPMTVAVVNGLFNMDTPEPIVWAATCQWFEGDRLHQDCYPTEWLEPVPLIQG